MIINFYYCNIINWYTYFYYWYTYFYYFKHIINFYYCNIEFYISNIFYISYRYTLGGISQMLDLMLLGIHSTKYEEFLF